MPVISARTAARPGAPISSWMTIRTSGKAALKARTSGFMPSRPGAWPGARGMSCQSVASTSSRRSGLWSEKAR
ncbi:hypothetical protein AZA_43566 [Nitrospirillum viridazoti Y2]|nr:hypothetical protein AZA_43566 [Nitrospirillum amazonense Y2]